MTTTTTTITATDNTRRSMTIAEATRMYQDATDAALMNGVEVSPAVYKLVVGDITIVFDWSRNKLTLTDFTGDLLMVATWARTGLGVCSWRQAGWCWRRALKVALK